MKIKSFILLFYMVIGTTINSRTEILCTNRVAGDESPIWCEISTLFRDVKLMPEGLLLVDYSRKGDPVIFVKAKNVNREKWVEFQCFMKRNDFFSYKDDYNLGFLMLDGPAYKIHLRRDASCKTIYYTSCYHEKIDSIFYYMNSFIPKKYRKNYGIIPPTGQWAIEHPCE